MVYRLSGACGLTLMLTLSACGDDDGGTGGAGPGGTGGTDSGTCEDEAIDVSSCSTVVSPGDDDTTSVQEALIQVQTGGTVCLCPGTYNFEKELSLTADDVTIKGLGGSREDVILDFAAQTSGDDGITVTSDGFTIEHLSVRNTPGNGIVVTGVEGVTFRDLKVSWDAGSVTENGAYAVYPVKSSQVIVEDTEVVGAADAGIYVGQCEKAIVRNNVVYGNVAGIEIENTTDSEVYGNQAYDNAAGILVFVLPNLEKKDGMRARVFDNQVYDNNRPNFGVPGTIVASVPSGLGMLVLAADDSEIHDNTIEDNDSTGILLVSMETLSILLPGGEPDPATDGYPERTYIHGNVFSGNGAMPGEVLAALGQPTLEDVLWDGIESPAAPGGAGELCLTSTPPSFRNFAGVAGIGDPTLQSTDTTPHECDGQALEPLSW